MCDNMTDSALPQPRLLFSLSVSTVSASAHFVREIRRLRPGTSFILHANASVPEADLEQLQNEVPEEPVPDIVRYALQTSLPATLRPGVKYMEELGQQSQYATVVRPTQNAIEAAASPKHHATTAAHEATGDKWLGATVLKTTESGDKVAGKVERFLGLLPVRRGLSQPPSRIQAPSGALERDQSGAGSSGDESDSEKGSSSEAETERGGAESGSEGTEAERELSEDGSERDARAAAELISSSESEQAEPESEEESEVETSDDNASSAVVSDSEESSCSSSGGDKRRRQRRRKPAARRGKQPAQGQRAAAKPKAPARKRRRKFSDSEEEESASGTSTESEACVRERNGGSARAMAERGSRTSKAPSALAKGKAIAQHASSAESSPAVAPTTADLGIDGGGGGGSSRSSRRARSAGDSPLLEGLPEKRKVSAKPTAEKRPKPSTVKELQAELFVNDEEVKEETMDALREAFHDQVWPALVQRRWRIDTGNRPNDKYFMPPGTVRGKSRNRIDYFDSELMVLRRVLKMPDLRPLMEEIANEYILNQEVANRGEAGGGILSKKKRRVSNVSKLLQVEEEQRNEVQRKLEEQGWASKTETLVVPAAAAMVLPVDQATVEDAALAALAAALGSSWVGGMEEGGDGSGSGASGGGASTTGSHWGARDEETDSSPQSEGRRRPLRGDSSGDEDVTPAAARKVGNGASKSGSSSKGRVAAAESGEDQAACSGGRKRKTEWIAAASASDANSEKPQVKRARKSPRSALERDDEMGAGSGKLGAPEAGYPVNGGTRAANFGTAGQIRCGHVGPTTFANGANTLASRPPVKRNGLTEAAAATMAAEAVEPTYLCRFADGTEERLSEPELHVRAEPLSFGANRASANGAKPGAHFVVEAMRFRTLWEHLGTETVVAADDRDDPSSILAEAERLRKDMAAANRQIGVTVAEFAGYGCLNGCALAPATMAANASQPTAAALQAPFHSHTDGRVVVWSPGAARMRAAEIGDFKQHCSCVALESSALPPGTLAMLFDGFLHGAHLLSECAIFYRCARIPAAPSLAKRDNGGSPSTKGLKATLEILQIGSAGPHAWPTATLHSCASSPGDGCVVCGGGDSGSSSSGGGTSLIKCVSCHRRYHRRCMRPRVPAKLAIPNDWRCPRCAAQAMLEKPGRDLVGAVGCAQLVEALERARMNMVRVNTARVIISGE